MVNYGLPKSVLTGTLKTFRGNYALPIERYRNKDAARALAQVIKPFILRRLKPIQMSFPISQKKIEMIEYTSLTEEQAAILPANSG